MRLTSGALLLVLVLAPGVGRADEEAPAEEKGAESGSVDELNPNAVSVLVGGQVEIHRYRSGFMLGGGYARWLKGILWLDLATTVIVHRNTNFALDAGIKLRWPPTKSKVRPYVRVLAELAVLAESTTAFVLGVRAGGGATYYSSPGFGAFIEGTISVGPSFGGGVAVASSLELLAGVEFPF